ncbi:hypothetical protein MIR68_011460 [Amoeboaphelidium protococcarum]|nr:hypothetical protein MIR68_011460 [Amoeboaphelidium protococcarum]
MVAVAQRELQLRSGNKVAQHRRALSSSNAAPSSQSNTESRKMLRRSNSFTAANAVYSLRMALNAALKHSIPERDIVDVDAMDIDSVSSSASSSESPRVKSCLKKSRNASSKKQSNQFRFNEVVLVGEAHHREDYDRKSDFVLHLTPAIAMMIKRELNDFKSNEMPVHETSRIYTHLFKL